MPEFCLARETAEHLGGADLLGCEVRSEADMAEVIESGLPTESLRSLVASGVSEREVETLVIKPRTRSHRRANGQRLTVDESDRAARVARTVALAEQTFVNRDKASRWLHRELHALRGRRPIDLVRTHSGSRIVEDALTRIAWGVPP